jgi:hypothetical protein
MKKWVPGEKLAIVGEGVPVDKEEVALLNPPNSSIVEIGLPC